MKSTILLQILVLPLLSCAAWAQNDRDIEACHDKESTLAIVGCLDTLSVAADKHLNAAYRTTLKSVDPSGIAALRAAERAWLEFRKQRCAYLGAGPGTIGQVIASDCMLRMTIQRADELDGDSKGIGN